MSRSAESKKHNKSRSRRRLGAVLAAATVCAALGMLVLSSHWVERGPSPSAASPVATVEPSQRARAVPPPKRRIVRRTRLVRRALLDRPVDLELPASLSATAVRSRVEQAYWRLHTYRHSRLTPPERQLEVVVALPDPRSPKQWAHGGARVSAGPGRVRTGRFRLPNRGQGVKWPYRRNLLELRRALLLACGARATVRLRVPQRAVLRFSVGLLPHGRGRQPVRVTVRVRDTAGARRLSVQPLTLRPPHRDRWTRSLGAEQNGRWHPARLDLGPWAGREVALEFAVTPTPGLKGQCLGVVALARPALLHPASTHRPNVLVLVLDATRADSLGCYGNRQVKTPGIDSLARQGTRFADAYTNAGWTRPSLMALMTGRYPGRAAASPGYFTPALEHKRYIASGGAGDTLFARLARHGYDTLVVGNNFILLPHNRLGMDFGFSSVGQIRAYPASAENDAITTRTVRALSTLRDRRFAMYVHYMSVHAPYDPPAAERKHLKRRLGKSGALTAPQRYLAEVMHVDGHVQRLLLALERLGLARDTLVALTADHGEILDEQHSVYLPRLRHHTRYHHSAALYEEVLRIPFLLRGPGVTPGLTVRQRYQAVDFAPTLLELLDLPAMEGVHGQSLGAALAGREAPELRDVYAVARRQVSLVRGQVKLIRRYGAAQEMRRRHGTVIKRRVELYDLRQDPREHRDLSGRRPRLLRTMLDALGGYLQRDRLPWAPAP